MTTEREIFICIIYSRNELTGSQQTSTGKKLTRKKNEGKDFSGSPVVRTLSFHSRGYGFDYWSGTESPLCGILTKSGSQK